MRPDDLVDVACDRGGPRIEEERLPDHGPGPDRKESALAVERRRHLLDVGAAAHPRYEPSGRLAGLRRGLVARTAHAISITLKGAPESLLPRRTGEDRVQGVDPPQPGCERGVHQVVGVAC